MIPIKRSSKTSVYLQISEAVIRSIHAGHLKAGQRLPGSRKLAELLNLNRKTVILAYEELLAQGWIHSGTSRGTFIADTLPIVQALTIEDPQHTIANKAAFSWQVPDFLKQPLSFSQKFAFDDGLPDIRLAPIEELARAYARNLRRLWDCRQLSYADALGYYPLREAFARELNASRGLNITPDNIMITRGSQMAIFLAARVLLSASSKTVVMTDPGYRTASLNFRYAGGEIIHIPVDQDGMVISSLEKICRKRKVDLVYVTPHHHYPTTVMLTPERRMSLLQMADKYNFAILEDDYDFDFHYANSPVLPLASRDQQRRVLYIGSLSKNISPAIRIGYLIATPEIIKELPKIRRLLDRQGDLAMEAAIAELLKDGTIRRYLKKALKQYRQRRDLTTQLLKERLSDYIDFQSPAGGLAIWAKFHPSVHLPSLSKLLATHSMYLSDGHYYHPEENAIRMGFARMSEDEIAEAIQLLQKNITDLPGGRSVVERSW